MSLSELENKVLEIKDLSGSLNLIEELIKYIYQLSNKIEEQEKELAKFRKQSNKPQMWDGKPVTEYSTKKVLRTKKRGKKVAKQVKIDDHKQLPEVEECECGSREFVLVRTWNKLVQGLIIKRNNVKYYGRDKRCKTCGKLHRSQLPEGVNGHQFSPHLKSWLSVFKYECRMSEGLIKRFLAGIGVQISTTHINEIILENSNKLNNGYGHLRGWGLKLSWYFHSDATGFTRQAVKTGQRIKEHLNFVGHQFLSVFKITRRYNSMSLADKVYTNQLLKQISITDDASPNGKKMPIKRKQLCWVHEIRHYCKLAPKVRVHQKELKQILQQIRKWYKQAKNYGRDPTVSNRQELEQTFDEITNQVVQYEELAKRITLTHRKKSRLLLFLEYPGIPIQNNLAERDLRPAVLMRKLTGGTKSIAGNKSFERHMSVIQTAHKQGLNVFDTVHGLIMGTLDPFILTRKTLPAPSFKTP